MANTFKNRLFGQAVPSDIIDKFKRLGRGQKEPQPGEPVAPFKEPDFNLGETSAFARMWTVVETSVPVLADSGVKYENKEFTLFTINDNFEESYTTNPNEPIEAESNVGRVKQLGGKNPLFL